MFLEKEWIVMLYSNLDVTLRASFKSSVKRTIEFLLKATDYKSVKENISVVTSDFVHEVVIELMRIRDFQKWGDTDFEIDDEDMKVLILEIESEIRKRKPTEKQLSYYYGLLQELKLEEKVSDDYFVFMKRLSELIELSRSQKPATPKQIQTIKKLWKNTFGEELEVADNLSQQKIQGLFNIVNNAH